MDTSEILLPYQKKWVKDDTPVKFYEKSRRIGITWAEAAANVLEASAAKGMDIWYIGYNKDMAREYIDTCADWARKFNAVCGKIYSEEIIDEDKKILSYTLTFKSGYKITALSGRPSNLRGKQGKAVIDEAAFHEDLEEVMKAALAFLIWGGKVAVISTHNGEESPFNEYIKDIRAGKRKYSLHRTTFDDAIADGLYERVASITKVSESKEKWIASIYGDYGDNADEELRCIPSRSGGAYFTTALIENCMQPDIPIIRFNPPAADFTSWQDSRRGSFVSDWLEDNIAELLKGLNINGRHFLGEDFARSADLSVLWILAENSDLSLSTPFIVEMRNTPHKVQEQIAFYIIDRLPRFNGGAFDARGNGEYLAESATERYGEDLILSVKASESFYLNAFPKLKAYLEDKTISLPKSADILNDFRSVKVVKGVPKIVERVTDKTDKGKRHGDSVIACLMGVYARSELGEHEQVDYEKAYKQWWG